MEKLRAALTGKDLPGSSSSWPSCSARNVEGNRSSLELYTGFLGLEKSKVMEIVNKSMEELLKMATAREPLWLQSVETGREILNYDEYIKSFPTTNSNMAAPKRLIEASRATGTVFTGLPRLVQTFMDVVRK